MKGLEPLENAFSSIELLLPTLTVTVFNDVERIESLSNVVCWKMGRMNILRVINKSWISFRTVLMKESCIENSFGSIQIFKQRSH